MARMFVNPDADVQAPLWLGRATISMVWPPYAPSYYSLWTKAPRSFTRRCADASSATEPRSKFLIYRGEDESDWILEVEDESGGSTVWTETFASDTAALEEVMSVIEEEGIEIFLVEDGNTLH